MTRIQVDKNVAYILDKDIYTRGQVGAQIRFEFSNDWSNYVKVVVFVAGEVYKNVIVTESGVLASVTVPWEVLTVANTVLRVGVYGSNSLGTKLVPTIWCDLGVVRDSADPIVDIDPSPDFIKQLMQVTAETKEYSDEARASAARIENMTVHATQLPSGSLPEVVKTVGNVVDLEFRIPKGDAGAGITRVTSNQSYDGKFTEIHMFLSDGSTYNASIPNGTPGVSITSVELISGDHTPGTYDIYNINFSDNRVPTSFKVYNGADSPVLTVNDKSPDINGNIKIELSDLGVTAKVKEIDQLHESNISKDDLNKLHKIKATADEIDKLHYSSVSVDDLNKLHSIEASANEIDKLHDSSVSVYDFNKLHSIEANAEELNQLHDSNIDVSDLIKLHSIESTAEELNLLHNSDINKDDLNKLHKIKASAEEIDKLHESSVSVDDLNKLHDIDATAEDINKLHESSVSVDDFNKLHDIESTAEELNQLHDSNIDVTDLDKLHSTESTAEELSVLHNSDVSKDDLIKLHSIEASANEINKLNRVIAPVQEQIDSKPDITVDRHVLNINYANPSYDPILREVPAQLSKSVIASDYLQYIKADVGYNAIRSIKINSIIRTEPTLIANNIKRGVSIFGIIGTYIGGEIPFEPEGLQIQQYKIITPTNEIQEIVPDPDFDGIAKVIIRNAATSDPNLRPENVKYGITIFGVEGTYGRRNDIMVTTIQSNKIVYPSTTDRIIYPDEDYEAMSMVTLESTIHTDSDLIPENIKAGVSLFDVLGTYAGSTEFIPTGVTVEIAKSANPSNYDVNVWADDGYSAMKSLFVNSVSNAEPNLIPENIKAGVSIYGIVGTYDGT